VPAGSIDFSGMALRPLRETFYADVTAANDRSMRAHRTPEG
jgi:hypothetical protein